ncbi:MAG: Mut7-C RNAse domain-containing protein [Desulfobacterales bacterium]|nr:Mut7-C RNAse domain-containing protein [Desulfobacterales bacterium]
MTREDPLTALFRFQAERSLGKLAKWLRLLGFDTTWEGDPQAAATAEAVARILLTRTRRRLPQPPGAHVHFVAANDPFRQLQQLVAALGIQRSDTRPLSRCIRCNQTIVAVGREEVRDKVPDYVWATHENFNTCRRCGRIYWPGSHTRRSLDRIKSLFQPVNEGDCERRSPNGN